jgi:hypothetical protein
MTPTHRCACTPGRPPHPRHLNHLNRTSPNTSQCRPHLTTQMLWRSRRLQLLTPRSGMGVEGPPARRGAGLGQPTPADVGRGAPLPREPLTAPPPPPLLLVAPAAKDLRMGVPAGRRLGVLPGAGSPGDCGARDCRLLLEARAALAARAAAASCTAAARPSRTSNS